MAQRQRTGVLGAWLATAMLLMSACAGTSGEETAEQRIAELEEQLAALTSTSTVPATSTTAWYEVEPPSRAWVGAISPDMTFGEIAAVLGEDWTTRGSGLPEVSIYRWRTSGGEVLVEYQEDREFGGESLSVDCEVGGTVRPRLFGGLRLCESTVQDLVGWGEFSVDSDLNYFGCADGIYRKFALSASAGTLTGFTTFSNSPEGGPIPECVSDEDGSERIGRYPTPLPLYGQEPPRAGGRLANGSGCVLPSGGGLLPDGIWFGRLVEVSAIGGGYQLGLDVACMYSWEAALFEVSAGWAEWVAPDIAVRDTRAWVYSAAASQSSNVYRLDDNRYHVQVVLESWINDPTRCRDCAVWLDVWNGRVVTLQQEGIRW